MGKWADLAENLKKRDKQQVDDINGFYGGGPTIENRIALADARAMDALATLLQVLAYLDAHDIETPNAKASGASTASAGLPGYAGDNNGEPQ